MGDGRCTRSGSRVCRDRQSLLRLSAEKLNRRIALLRLAESLGAEAVYRGGSSAR